MRWKLCCLFIATLARTGEARELHLRYKFSPIVYEGSRAFHVTLAFRVTARETKIGVPSKWGDAIGIEKQIRNLRCETEGARMLGSSDVTDQIVEASPKTLVRLSYDLIADQSGPLGHPLEHRPVLKPDYFLFNVRNALVFPSIAREQVIRATFDWSAMPRGMPILTSFGFSQRVQSVRLPAYRIQGAVFAGGNFRTLQKKSRGSVLIVAINGTWRFSDQQAFATIERIISEENRFWHKQPLHYYLMTLAPFEQDSGAQNGSAFTNAFALFFSRQDTFTERIQMTVAHEVFHQWNPLSMGPSESSVQWFSEGFTRYYQSVLLLRSGALSFKEYLQELNDILRQYASSGIRNISNAKWNAMDHTMGDGSLLPYLRGAAIALWADARIRAASGGTYSLDNVMFDLLDDGGSKNGRTALTQERILRVFAKYLSEADRTILKKLVAEGIDVPVLVALGSCAKVETVSLPKFELGFDRNSLDQNRLSGVDADSAAYRAGLRDGQEVTRVSIYNGNPEREVTIGVRTGKGVELIRYLPVAPEPLIVGQYRATVRGDTAPVCTPF